MKSVHPHETTFNHIGLCVTDLERSKRFYVDALGFTYWWELEAPEESSRLVMLDTPLELKATYLVRDGLVLELLTFHPDRLLPVRPRTLAEPGLTHISMTVPDLDAAMERVVQFGGQALPETHSGTAVMVRDPDGQLIELLTPEFRDARPPWPG